MNEDNKSSDLDILEDMRDRLYNAFKNNNQDLKVGDLLKIIELKRKLSVEGKGEKKFWEMVNKFRKEELSKSPSRKMRERAKND